MYCSVCVLKSIQNIRNGVARVSALPRRARFRGAELEAAAALFSVLRTESHVGQAKATATLKAAGAGGKQGAGVDLRAALGAQLPLPALIAAAQSLRKIGVVAAREASSWAAGGGVATEEGGVEIAGGVGQPSVVRLVRYLTRQGDK